MEPPMKPYICLGCSQSFPNAVALKKHQKDAHQSTRVMCPDLHDGIEVTIKSASLSSVLPVAGFEVGMAPIIL